VVTALDVVAELDTFDDRTEVERLEEHVARALAEL